MPEKVSQLGWSSLNRFGIIWSNAPYWRRFHMVKTGSGYTVSDQVMGDLVRVRTKAAARAWAGIRVNEQCVRHGR